MLRPAASNVLRPDSGLVGSFVEGDDQISTWTSYLVLHSHCWTWTFRFCRSQEATIFFNEYEERKTEILPGSFQTESQRDGGRGPGGGGVEDCQEDQECSPVLPAAVLRVQADQLPRPRVHDEGDGSSRAVGTDRGAVVCIFGPFQEYKVNLIRDFH